MDTSSGKNAETIKDSFEKIVITSKRNQIESKIIEERNFYKSVFQKF